MHITCTCSFVTMNNYSIYHCLYCLSISDKGLFTVAVVGLLGFLSFEAWLTSADADCEQHTDTVKVALNFHSRLIGLQVC